MKISVVVPLYNKETSVIFTLKSVLNQSYKNYEIIVVNDGSTDNSLSVIERFKAEEDMYDRIRIINKQNGGVSSARNAGINAALGQYISFLDADDLWSPGYLETLSIMIDKYPDAGLYSIGYQSLFGVSLPNNKDNTKLNIEIVNTPWDGSFKLWTGSSSCSRANLIDIGGFDERMTHGEDIDLWWRIILYKGAVRCTNTLAFYRQDAENRAMNRVIPLEKHIPFYIEKYKDFRHNNADFRAYFDTQMIYRLYPYLFNKKYKKEAKRLSRLLDYSQLKRSMHFRMQYPYFYRFYEKIKSYI